MQKNPILLLNALASLGSRNFKLTMVGNGPLMGSVRRHISSVRLDEFVELTGWLGAAEVERRMRGSDVLVMPSLSEGLPLVGIEALKCGLAIVATDVPGLRDVVADGINGYRVPSCDRDAFAHKLQWLIESEGTLVAMKRASWEKAREFDLARITGQYERVLLASARRPSG